MAGRLSSARKFALAYVALAALVGVAVGTFVLLVERPAPPPPPPWSLWRPTATDRLVRAQEIATHVASQYHLASGNRLVRVYVGGPASAADPIREVAITTTTTPKTQNDVRALFPADNTIMFVLCGGGDKCAISEGKPSTARAAVLRREALELALYTFEYVKDTTSVVTFFPPKKGDDPTYALFFDRASFNSQLDHPLRKTLPRAVAPSPGHLAADERKTVDALTTQRVFRFALQRQQNGSRVLVLAPPS